MRPARGNAKKISGRAGRSPAAWVGTAVVLFPFASIVWLILFEWFSGEPADEALAQR